MFMTSDKDIAKNPMRRKLYPLVTDRVSSIVTMMTRTTDTDTGMLCTRDWESGDIYYY